MARKFSESAQEETGETTHELKRGKPRSDSGKKVTSHEQAGASGLAEARKGGSKVPPRAKAER